MDFDLCNDCFSVVAGGLIGNKKSPGEVKVKGGELSEIKGEEGRGGGFFEGEGSR